MGRRIKSKMAKRGKTHKKKNLEAWLLDLQKHISEPIVVSLLVQNDEICFESCMAKGKYIDDPDEPESSSPEIDIHKAQREVKSLQLDYNKYIG